MTIGANLAMAPEASRQSGRDLAWVSTARKNTSGIAAQRDLAGGSFDRANLARAAIEARLALEEAVDAATLAAQRAQSVSAALEEALANLAFPAAASASGEARIAERAAGPALSPREREVLALVAEGRSNKAIAQELFVSPNTIKTHVASLLNKLRAETRVQLAVIAARQAML